MCTSERYGQGMTDPRAALERLTAAFEEHLNAIQARRSEEDPAVDDAYYVLADAFEAYDDALATVHGEALPFYLAEEDDEDDDGDEDEGDDEDDEGDEDDDDEDLDVDADDLEGLSENDIEALVDPDRG